METYEGVSSEAASYANLQNLISWWFLWFRWHQLGWWDKGFLWRKCSWSLQCLQLAYSSLKDGTDLEAIHAAIKKQLKLRTYLWLKWRLVLDAVLQANKELMRYGAPLGADETTTEALGWDYKDHLKSFKFTLISKEMLPNRGASAYQAWTKSALKLIQNWLQK